MSITETKNNPNADIHDLYLSDDMIALLKSGKLNTRLLCEMALHKDFQRMMVDIEIFVDRLADMRINDMNTVLNATRQQVIETYNPRENDLYVRTLALAQINEDDYWGHVVHQDTDSIMQDIRDAHRKDTLTADAETPAMEAQKQLEIAMIYESSEDEKKAPVFLATMGFDYDALTQEEFVTVITVLKNPAHMKSPYSQRDKAPYQPHGKEKTKIVRLEEENQMEILLIGNGFDIEHDLPTSYSCFLDFCKKVRKIYTYDISVPKSVYENEVLSGWDFNESIKGMLLSAFETRFVDSITFSEVSYDAIIRTNIPELNEMYSYIKFNAWLEYFWARSEKIGNNWIDFETEISSVIKALDSSKKYLSIHKDILNSNLKDSSVLMGIMKAAKTSLQTVFRDTDAVENFAIYLNKELDKLIRTLEIYISCFVNKVAVSRLSEDIKDLNPNHILSFNYSNTYERVYGAGKNIQYGYIHGKANSENNVESCNMVLGIDEYLKGDSKNTELEFLTFKKYYQRIYKSTGHTYLDWVDEIKDGYADYLRELDAAYAVSRVLKKDRPNTIKHNGRIYTEAPLSHCPKHTLYIFGHSLDVTDQDVLRMFICNDNVQTKIFYHRKNADDKKSLGRMIKNLIRIMGQEELIRRTGGAHKTIEFIPQALHKE